MLNAMEFKSAMHFFIDCFCSYFSLRTFIVLLDWIIVVLFSCMQRRTTIGDLIPIDLEIDATCRRRNMRESEIFCRI